MSKFWKAIAPSVMAVIAIGISWVASGSFDLAEFGIAGAGLFTSIGVYWIPNLATTPYLKSLVPAALGIVAVGARAIEVGSLDVADLRTAIAALLTVGVVWVVPNEAPTFWVPSSDPPPVPGG